MTRTSTRVVVGWHARRRAGLLRGVPADAAGLTSSGSSREEERRLVRVIDEIVGATAADASDTAGTGIAFSDALLEELDRSRDGAMRDVVATIQAEQYAIIRAPLEGVVVVQGGPGTGKTVVGLHRAAWLAFNYAELRRDRHPRGRTFHDLPDLRQRCPAVPRRHRR